MHVSHDRVWAQASGTVISSRGPHHFQGWDAASSARVAVSCHRAPIPKAFPSKSLIFAQTCSSVFEDCHASQFHQIRQSREQGAAVSTSSVQHAVDISGTCTARAMPTLPCKACTAHLSESEQTCECFSSGQSYKTIVGVTHAMYRECRVALRRY